MSSWRARDPDFGKRLVGYILAGVVSGAIAGALFGESIRDAIQPWIPLPWLPQKRAAYGILGAEIFGLAGLFRAVIRSRKVDSYQLIAEALGLRYVSRPPHSCMRDVALLFDGHDLSDLRNVFVGSYRSFNYLIADGYCESGDSCHLNASLVIVWNASLSFPRCIALPVIDATRWLASIRQMQIRYEFGKSRVNVSDDAAFMNRYSVIGGDAEAIAFLVNSDVQQLLLRTVDGQLRTGGGCLALWQPASRELEIADVRNLQLDAKRLINGIRESDPQLEAWDKENRQHPPPASKLDSSIGVHRSESLQSRQPQQTVRQLSRQAPVASGKAGDAIQRYLATAPPRAWTLTQTALLGLRSLWGCLLGVAWSLFSLPFFKTGMFDPLGILLGCLFLISGSTVLHFSTAFYRRAKRLLRYGSYAEAEVRDVRRAGKGFYKTFVARLVYNVGSELVDTEVDLYPHEAMKLLVAQESTETVSLVYDPKRPKLCMIRQQFMHGFGIQN